MNTDTLKTQIIAGLDAWIRQRPGLEFGNYGSVKGYQTEVRGITRDLRQARILLAAVKWRDSITGSALLEAFKHAYSGRLSCEVLADGRIKLDYCTGQYWPTEYRRAVCAVLASALWSWQRNCMPSAIVVGGQTMYPYSAGAKNVKSAGDWLRATFRKEFGRGIADRWFN